jgi:transcription elongation factor Elf1
MALDERAFFTEKAENRPGKFQCPRCRRTNEYSIRWVRRARKDRLPPGADDADRAKFAKLRDYLLRVDDEVTCKTCGKKFEIPSQHSLMFVDQLAGLPNDEELEREIAEAAGDTAPPDEKKPELPARFTRRSSGWK